MDRETIAKGLLNAWLASAGKAPIQFGELDDQQQTGFWKEADWVLEHFAPRAEQQADEAPWFGFDKMDNRSKSAYLRQATEARNASAQPNPAKSAPMDLGQVHHARKGETFTLCGKDPEFLRINRSFVAWSMDKNRCQYCEKAVNEIRDPKSTQPDTSALDQSWTVDSASRLAGELQCVADGSRGDLTPRLTSGRASSALHWALSQIQQPDTNAIDAGWPTAEEVARHLYSGMGYNASFDDIVNGETERLGPEAKGLMLADTRRVIDFFRARGWVPGERGKVLDVLRYFRERAGEGRSGGMLRMIKAQTFETAAEQLAFALNEPFPRPIPDPEERPAPAAPAVPEEPKSDAVSSAYRWLVHVHGRPERKLIEWAHVLALSVPGGVTKEQACAALDAYAREALDAACAALGGEPHIGPELPRQGRPEPVSWVKFNSLLCSDFLPELPRQGRPEPDPQPWGEPDAQDAAREDEPPKSVTVPAPPPEPADWPSAEEVAREAGLRDAWNDVSADEEHIAEAVMRVLRERGFVSPEEHERAIVERDAARDCMRDLKDSIEALIATWKGGEQ